MKRLLSFLIYHFFNFLKLKNRVILFCFDGDFVGDNIVYIIEKLESENVDYRFVSSKKYVGKCKNVRKYSFNFFYYFYSSKIVITNTNVPSVCRKKNNQIFINTWHGAGGLKGYINGTYNYNIFDYFVSESEFDTKNFRITTAWNYKNNILKIGMPRNDIFYKKFDNLDLIKKKVGIFTDTMVVLYAPTMRECSKSIFIDDFTEIVQSFSKKYNKLVTLLIRNHHYQHKYGDIIKDYKDVNCLDVSSYDNMQELLFISDALITDYSSCAWDFTLMKKPVFLYATDYNEYILSRGNSFIDYNKLPYGIAYTINDLCKLILNFDYQSYLEKLNQYYDYVGKYDVNGDSMDKLFYLIKNTLQK